MGNAESTQSADDTQMQQQQQQSTDDEPWWNNIEHEDLILEQAPRAIAQRAAEEVPPDNRTKNRENQVAIEMEDKRDGSPQKEQTLEEFREELRQKKEVRQNAVQGLRDEIASLKEQLAKEKSETLRLRKDVVGEGQADTQRDDSETPSKPGSDSDPDDENPSSRSRHANIELANAQLALQQTQAENLSLRGEVEVVQRQVGTLKEVISCCKQMLSVKEEQCAQLKMKLTEIENSFSEREMKIMSNNLRQEYERQLVNIRQLRQLYEERQRVAAAEYENLQRLISIKRDELTAEQEKSKSLEERNHSLLKEVEMANEELAKLREECSEHKFEKRLLSEQVGAVNMLFSQLIMGFNGKSSMDIDRVNRMLEENRHLLNQMTQAEGNCSDGATLPKLLFELVEQATGHGDSAEESDKSRSATPTPTATTEDTTDGCQPGGAVEKCRKGSSRSGSGSSLGVDATAASLKSHEPEIMGKVASAQEIIGNLPKVWKVLMELLSHHKIERVQLEELPSSSAAIPSSSASNASGKDEGESHRKPAELSVSKTYIKLKDLILEKKSLVKETNRLKTLNSHLDYRLNQQEKRLSGVSLELTKTWHLVGKMQRQHRQLHTQEQILRYQLQQKRRLLSELKDELEYCRRKWALARAKNDESQEQCDEWRREFARRKLEDANHSAESGYSDSGPQSDEERDLGTVDPVEVPTSSVPCRRKLLRDQFEHTRKIKRMQSTSPGRQGFDGEDVEADNIVLRWNSAPPTCGWREEGVYPSGEEGSEVGEHEEDGAHGVLPKSLHSSRSRQRGVEGSSEAAGTASRIQKLEEQCKNLIQQVLETSGNRERLEIQLCQFQDDIAPAQHAVPLEEFINRKRIERMTRASSAPATGSLTPREEEYTRKRSERLGRLEEESRQLMSRIRRTADRGHYLKKSLDRIRRAPSREASFESNTEEEAIPAPKRDSPPATSPLTAEEEEYTSRRAARIQRMEHESRQLISQLSRNAERGENFATKLDTLHEQYGPNPQLDQARSSASVSHTLEQRLEDIERVSANRAERLRLLELQGNELIARLSSTSERGTAMINRIAEREATRRQEAELVEQAVPSEEATSSNASTRIVGHSKEEGEGAACCVTVTTTASQLALKLQSTGAIPKSTAMRSRPQSQLCAATRQDDAARKRSSGREAVQKEAPETLEDMVQRLRALPFPEKTQETESVESENKSTETSNSSTEYQNQDNVLDIEGNPLNKVEDENTEGQESGHPPLGPATSEQLDEQKHMDSEH